ncbi:MAG: fasciclin domain-containing protein [Sphingomonadales bacterium]|nr:fasciclin domain-containing protein [Sphingomonadales bacterium]
MTFSRILRPRTLALAALAASASFAVLTPAATAGQHGSHQGHVAVKSTVVDIAVASPDHKTLVAAVQAAGLVETLQGGGPFTVFAPTDMAFGKLPAGTVETLVKPENKALLTKILTYHVVAGNVSSSDLLALIKKGKGKAVITTVAGDKLTARLHGKAIVITDAKGRGAMVTTPNLKAGNGIVHVVNGVFLPG